MKLFGSLYDRVLSWSSHRHAPAYLSGLSFAESSFFPIPPDVMLMPMALARPKCWWWFATLATLFSALGGLFGYLLGWLLIDAVMPHLLAAGFGPAIDQAKAWFAQWGVWAIIVAGFSPIPYKVFTILAGALTMNPFWFFIASVIGRGGRFYLVAGLIAWAGPKIAPRLRQYIEWLGWGTVLLLILAIVVWRFG
ncbi:YqaA family protein [Halothiobacillus sp. DCM-1]|uniref:YqaA family protein n=1 Tax=Halothiobacillus sp. DCM-1 TaxID=3112558 RepID=UPI00324F8967